MRLLVNLVLLGLLCMVAMWLASIVFGIAFALLGALVEGVSRLFGHRP